MNLYPMGPPHKVATPIPLPLVSGKVTPHVPHPGVSSFFRIRHILSSWGQSGQTWQLSAPCAGSTHFFKVLLTVVCPPFFKNKYLTVFSLFLSPLRKDSLFCPCCIVLFIQAASIIFSPYLLVYRSDLTLRWDASSDSPTSQTDPET